MEEEGEAHRLAADAGQHYLGVTALAEERVVQLRLGSRYLVLQPLVASRGRG